MANESSNHADEHDNVKDECSRVSVYCDAHADIVTTHVDLLMSMSHMPRADLYPFRDGEIVSDSWLYHHCSNCAIFTVSDTGAKSVITNFVLFALTLRLEATTQDEVHVDFTDSGDGLTANVLIHGARLRDCVDTVTDSKGRFIHSVVVRGKRQLSYEERFETLFALMPLVMQPEKRALVLLSGSAYGLDLLLRVQPVAPDERKLFKDPFSKDAKLKNFLPPYHPTLQHKWYGRYSRLLDVVLAEEAVHAISNTLCVDMRTFVLETFRTLSASRPMLCVTFQMLNMCFTSARGLAGLFWLGKSPTKGARYALRCAVLTAVKQLLALETSTHVVDVELLTRSDVGPNMHTLLVRYSDTTVGCKHARLAALKTAFQKNVLGVEFILSARHHKPSQVIIADLFHAMSIACGFIYGSMSFNRLEPFSSASPRVEICNDASNTAKDAAAFFKRMHANSKCI